MGCTCAIAKRRREGLKRSFRRSIHVVPNIIEPFVKLDLTDRQIFLLQQSWKGISRKMEYTGINMFIRIFETHAELKKFFFMIEDCQTLSEMRQSKSLAKHVVMVMNTIDDVIYNLHDMQSVSSMLQETGRTHRKFLEFRREFFLAVIDPFLLAIKETLGERYTPNMKKIYRKIIRFIIDSLIYGFDNCPAENIV